VEEVSRSCDESLAHWDEERDQRWLEMIRGCNVPGAEEIIHKFEVSGNL